MEAAETLLPTLATPVAILESKNQKESLPCGLAERATDTYTILPQHTLAERLNMIPIMMSALRPLQEKCTPERIAQLVRYAGSLNTSTCQVQYFLEDQLPLFLLRKTPLKDSLADVTLSLAISNLATKPPPSYACPNFAILYGTCAEQEGASEVSLFLEYADGTLDRLFEDLYKNWTAADADEKKAIEGHYMSLHFQVFAAVLWMAFREAIVHNHLTPENVAFASLRHNTAYRYILDTRRAFDVDLHGTLAKVINFEKATVKSSPSHVQFLPAHADVDSFLTKAPLERENWADITAETAGRYGIPPFARDALVYLNAVSHSPHIPSPVQQWASDGVASLARYVERTMVFRKEDLLAFTLSLFLESALTDVGSPWHVGDTPTETFRLFSTRT